LLLTFIVKWESSEIIPLEHFLEIVLFNLTGLGLAITYRTLKNHCGKVSATNSPEGRAMFTLPLRAADYPCPTGDRNGATDIAD